MVAASAEFAATPVQSGNRPDEPAAAGGAIGNQRSPSVVRAMEPFRPTSQHTVSEIGAAPSQACGDGLACTTHVLPASIERWIFPPVPARHKTCPEGALASINSMLTAPMPPKMPELLGAFGHIGGGPDRGSSACGGSSPCGLFARGRHIGHSFRIDNRRGRGAICGLTLRPGNRRWHGCSRRRTSAPTAPASAAGVFLSFLDSVSGVATFAFSWSNDLVVPLAASYRRFRRRAGGKLSLREAILGNCGGRRRLFLGFHPGSLVQTGRIAFPAPAAARFSAPGQSGFPMDLAPVCARAPAWRTTRRGRGNAQRRSQPAGAPVESVGFDYLRRANRRTASGTRRRNQFAEPRDFRLGQWRIDRRRQHGQYLPAPRTAREVAFPLFQFLRLQRSFIVRGNKGGIRAFPCSGGRNPVQGLAHPARQRFLAQPRS